MVAYICNPSIREAEAGGSQASLDYILQDPVSQKITFFKSQFSSTKMQFSNIYSAILFLKQNV
jgi:hypothetical protein